ncbi:MAG TPA: acyl-CoA dehydrogenase family protein [Deltaproteobacteria bacterium]|jgi:alkylation response protein AidB-like acyl-CoA dehydrogenase|nr:acyl-CoA dehydrogenase family protein [Deltaproteobacteria bacterium]HOI05667.1 acyl-CoA dehydrogenase family protein [Deltaproteobacteria bacterium]
MDYQYSPEETKLQQDTAAFCAREIAPRAALLDTCPPERACALMRENLKALGGAGILKHGFTGEGLDMVGHCIAGEEIAKACPATFMSARASAFLCAGAIRLFGTDDQKDRWLAPLLDGEAVGALAYSEEQAGTDMGAVATSAVRVGDTWLLNGTKGIVVNAPIADVILVLAYTDREAGKEGGMSLFLVEKGAEGLALGRGVETLGLRGLPASSLTLDGCVASGLLGDVQGQGFGQAGRLLSLGTVGIAALCVGIGTACMELSTNHARTRTAFGKRIGMYQDVGFKLADMFAYNDLGRVMALRAAWAMDTGEPGAEVLGACAKLFASEGVTKIANWGMQVFAGHGYLAGSGIEKLFRDAKFGEICEGTSEMQRQLIAKADLDRFAPVR